MVTHALLKLNAVTVGNGHVVHVHTEHKAAYVVCIGTAGSGAGPYGNLLLSLNALPVAYHNLAGYTHTGAYVTELYIAVGALVQVHEVHIDGVPGNIGVVLCVEVEQGLLKSLQTLDPHLGGAEGVHPGDDTYALAVIVGSLHHGLNLIAAVGSTFIYYLNGDVTALVQTINHLL